MTEGSTHITVRAHESKELGCLGDGAAGWNALKEGFDGNTKEARRAYVVHAVAVVPLHLVVGVVVLRRNVLLPDRLHKHLTQGPSAKYDA